MEGLCNMSHKSVGLNRRTVKAIHTLGVADDSVGIMTIKSRQGRPEKRELRRMQCYERIMEGQGERKSVLGDEV